MSPREVGEGVNDQRGQLTHVRQHGPSDWKPNREMSRLAIMSTSFGGKAAAKTIGTHHATASGGRGGLDTNVTIRAAVIDATTAGQEG